MVKAGQSIPITGFAQVGISGLKKVQVWFHPADKPLPTDDPYFATANWQDAEILAPPSTWGGGIADGKLPVGVMGFDSNTQQPKAWPMRYTRAHWAVLGPAMPPGKYQIRCRTIDANDVAQPMPRPFPKSGQNSIQQVELTIGNT